MIDYKVTTTTRVVIDYNQASRAPTRVDLPRRHSPPSSSRLVTVSESVISFLCPHCAWIAHVKLYGVHYVKYTVQYKVQKDRTTQIYTHARET